MEILAAIFFYLNFAFSAAASFLAVLLYRHYRSCGWLVLAVAFLSPFWFLLLRLAHGLPLRAYRSFGPVVNGSVQVNYHLAIPGFYLAVVIALLLLIRDAKRHK